MDSRQLKYFAAIYEHRTLTHAAEHMHVASSALSHNLGNLEANLKTKLFIREPRGMRPTAAGERLYTHARKIIKLMKDAERDIQTSGEGLSGTVSISMAYTLIKLIGVSLSTEILTKFPNVYLTLTESLSGLSVDHIVSAQVDLALAYNPPLEGTLKLDPILEESMVLFGHKTIIGADTTPITFEEILKLPLFLLGTGLSAKAVIDDPKLLEALRNAAIMHTYSVHAIRKLVRAKLGCVVAPRMLLNEYIGIDGLHSREIINPTLMRTLYACEIPDRAPTFAFEVIRKRIFSMIDHSIRSGEWQANSLMKEEWYK